jgi:hypothetical protein
MVAGAARFQLHEVQQAVGAQTGFFLKLTQRSARRGFTGLDFSAGQAPATPGLAHQENMSVQFTNDRCTYFHWLPDNRLLQKRNKNATFGP